ncbi:MAG TPA: glycosyl transferase family A [Streptomyces sp.]|nr:glycosyl transferase family A [Streptomyces sp.]
MTPRLSVIVPIYGVEQYLHACLDSLAAQTLADLEVIMVDDGSPDGSAAIAAEYQARDPRFKLVRKENAGLGAARNTGVAHSSPDSEYLAFVDSDDLLPPDAYRMLVGSLDETGSDFATGNVQHLNSRRVWQSPMHRMLAGGAVQRTHVRDNHKLLVDRTAWNKVFRRSFWEHHGFAFPEGVLYEDIEVSIPAHVLAESVDVIGEPVYYWRLRDGEGAPSITQRRTEPRGIRDRAQAVATVSRFLGSRPDDPVRRELKNAYDHRCLTDDLRIFLQVLPQAEEDFHDEFLRSVNDYLDQVDPKIVLDLPTPLRVKWLLVRKHAMGELLEMFAAERAGEPVELRGLLRKYARFSWLDASAVGLPRRVLRMDPELRLRAPLQELSWESGKLRLLGHARIDRIDQPTKHHAVKVVQLKKAGSRRRIVLPVRNVHRPEATANAQQHNYDWAGWELLLDPARLRKGGRWEEGVWHVGIAVATSGLVRKRSVHTSGPTAANHPPYQWLDGDFRLLPTITNGSLKLRVEKVRALVTGHRQDGDAVQVDGEIREPLAAGETVTLRVANRKSGEQHAYPAVLDTATTGHTSFRVRVPLQDVALVPQPLEPSQREGAAADTADIAQAAKRLWSTELVATGPAGTERRFSTVVREGLADHQIRLPASLGEYADRNELALLAGNNGYLKLCVRPLQARLTEVRRTDDRLLLTGSVPMKLSEPVLVLGARDQAEEKTVPVRLLPDGRFEAEFAPGAVPGPYGALPLRNGRWNLFLRSADGSVDVPFVIDRLAVPSFPVEVQDPAGPYALEARWHDFPQLNCAWGVGVMERGRYRQRKLEKGYYRASRQKPLRDAVLYISYNGRQFSDSPRAIHEELTRRGTDLEQLWVLRHNQVELPEPLRTVRMWSAEWYEALARCRYIVANAHLPHWLERREGQVVVQTWHGTMLKKIGLDIEAPKFDPEYHDRLRAEVRHWSLLVSANRFSTPILRRAMDYDGPVVESGYPRNDRLYSPDREVTGKAVRDSLGLPAGKKVVLYAPTWRDDVAYRQGRYRFDLRLDLEDARRRLGDDHVLLVRRHSNIVDAVPGAGDGFVFDVSEYPDITDLYLASDILITDYSSVMFDFAHLERPVLFFTYDLDHYRDNLRGFYFDFEKDAPGPLIRTSEELIGAIRDIDRVSAEYKEKYDRFRELFCDLDDGHAAERVVNRMLEIPAENQQ